MWCTSQRKCLRLVPYAVLEAFYAKLDALWRVLRYEICSSSHRHHRNRIAARINEEWRSARHADWLKDPFPYSTWIFHRQPFHNLRWLYVGVLHFQKNRQSGQIGPASHLATVTVIMISMLIALLGEKRECLVFLASKRGRTCSTPRRNVIALNVYRKMLKENTYKLLQAKEATLCHDVSWASSSALHCSLHTVLKSRKHCVSHHHSLSRTIVTQQSIVITTKTRIARMQHE